MDPRERVSRVQCNRCQEHAEFLTPVGTLCGKHALEEMLGQLDSADHWVPVPLVLRLVDEAESD